MTEHTCHLPTCDEEVQPEYLMCGEHWNMVPADIQAKVWKHYQPGQEHGIVTPSEEWHEAADKAIELVAEKEGLT